MSRSNPYECSIFDYPCNSPCMQYFFKRFLILHSSEVIFSFLIKKSRQKAIEIETAFFHPLGNPKGRTLDHYLTWPCGCVKSRNARSPSPLTGWLTDQLAELSTSFPISGT